VKVFLDVKSPNLYYPPQSHGSLINLISTSSGSHSISSNIGGLSRGERLTELLKQPQYSPMDVEEQVAVIFAGVKGYLDQIPTQKIGEFEQSLILYLNTKGSNILESIRKDKSISDDTEKALKDILDELVKNFA